MPCLGRQHRVSCEGYTGARLDRSALYRQYASHTKKAVSLYAEQVSREAGAAAAAAKGSYGVGIGEEWMAWLPVAWGLREYIEAMEAGGQPRPAGVTERPDGQLVVDAFPMGWGPNCIPHSMQLVACRLKYLSPVAAASMLMIVHLQSVQCARLWDHGRRLY